MPFIKDEIGNKHGTLTVIGFSHTTQRGAYWKCLCDCGNTTIISGSFLRSGHTKSCGCSRKRSQQPVKHRQPKARMVPKSRDLTKENNPNWKGGRRIHRNGYVLLYVPEHPKSGKRGEVYEHMIVMEKMLGGPIPEGAEIHHCNGDPTDNRPYNLRLFNTKGEHSKYHRLQAKEA